jgi:hypothetical protein
MQREYEMSNPGPRDRLVDGADIAAFHGKLAEAKQLLKQAADLGRAAHRTLQLVTTVKPKQKPRRS